MRRAVANSSKAVLRLVSLSALLWAGVAGAAYAQPVAAPGTPRAASTLTSTGVAAIATPAAPTLAPPAASSTPESLGATSQAESQIASSIYGLSRRFDAVCPGRLVQAVPVRVGLEPVGSLLVRRRGESFCALVQVDRQAVAKVEAHLQAAAANTAAQTSVNALNPGAVTTPAAPAVPVAPATPLQVSGPPKPGPGNSRLWMYAVVQRCLPTSTGQGLPGDTTVSPEMVCRDEASMADEGMFFFYAGPVTVPGFGQCMRAEGRIVVATNVEGFAQTEPSAQLCA